jgi:arylsulfatase A-like enzyme
MGAERARHDLNPAAARRGDLSSSYRADAVAERFSRRGLIGAAGLGVAAAAGAGLGLERSRAARPTPTVDRASHRNVVLIVIDSLRADHVGSFGNPFVATPNIDALASVSTRFVNHYPEAMPTVPARRTLITGRRVWPFFGWDRWDGLINRAGWAPVEAEAETIVKALRRQGWWTAMVTDNPFLGFTPSFGPVRESPHLFVPIVGHVGNRRSPSTASPRDAARRLPRAVDSERKLDTVLRYLANNGHGRDPAQVPAARVFRQGAAALERAAGQDRPFFLYVDSFDPHEPWAPPPEYMGLYTDPDRIPIADVVYNDADYMTARELETLAATYKAELTLTDRWLGHLMDRLHDLGLDESTVIALVSDHGVYVGDRDWTGKAPHLLHPELANTPLLVSDPESRAGGARSPFWATTVDVPRTLMSLAGATVPDEFQGIDLAPILDGAPPAEQRPYVHGGYGNYSFVRDNEWSYIVKNDRSDERLYHLPSDPGELDDVATANPEAVGRMWARIVEEAGGREPPFYAAAD